MRVLLVEDNPNLAQSLNDKRGTLRGRPYGGEAATTCCARRITRW